MKRAIVACVLAVIASAGCTQSQSGNDSAVAPDGGGVDAVATSDAAQGSDASAIDAASASDATTIDASSVTDASASDAATSSTDAGDCAAKLAEIGQRCSLPSDCAAGFTCQSVSGIVLQQSCQIRCDDPSFMCPCGTHCAVHNDKTGMPWHQCDI